EANALDSAGINHGTLFGNTTFSSGEVGSGFVVDGASDAVLVGNPTNLQLQDFTIEVWMKRTSTSLVTGSPGNNGLFFSYGAGGYGFGLDVAGHPFLSRIDTDLLPASVAITDTNFHHLAVTKSGSAVVFYVDGAANPAPVYGTHFVFSSPAAIGAR